MFFFSDNLLHEKFIQFANYQKQLYLEALYAMTNFKNNVRNLSMET